MPLFKIFFLGIFLLTSCRTAGTKQENRLSLEEYIHSKIAGARMDFNTSGDFILCQEKNPMESGGLLKFLIIRVSDRKIVTESSFRPGYIKWVNDNEIELFDAPGTIREDEDMDRYKKTILVRAIDPKP